MTQNVSKARVFLYELVPLFLMVAIPFSVHAGFMSTLLGIEEEISAPPEVVVTSSAVDAPMLASLQNADPVGATGGGDIFVDEGALVSTGPAGEDEMAESRLINGEISVYTVREGDSLSQIAEMFNVTTNTILWANDITKATAIQPGDTLVILPIVGVRHVVKDGDTVGAIAKKYDGDVDEILAYNQVASADDLSVGDTLTIPGGMIASAPARSYTPASPTKVTGNASAGGSFSHPLPGSVRTQGIHGYNAVDFGAPVGTPIRAAAAGEVIVSKGSGWNGGYGNYIVIRHSNGTQTLYSHNSSNAVGVGAWVSQGQTIGYVGSTGRSTGPHLHFEVRGARNPF